MIYTLYSGLRAMYFILYSILCTMYSVLFILFSSLCYLMYDVCSLFSFPLYPLLCSLFSSCHTYSSFVHSLMGLTTVLMKGSGPYEGVWPVFCI